MGEGDDCNAIKVLDEGETLAEQAVVNQVADSSNSRGLNRVLAWSAYRGPW